MDQNTRNQLITDTQEMALAFVEDMEHMRSILQSESPNRGDLRRLSGILRRLFIDNNGDLQKIAAPRIGKVMIESCDNKIFYAIELYKTFQVFVSGGAKVFGFESRSIVHASSPPPPHVFEKMSFENIFLDLDSFVNQRVIYFNSRWFNRRDIIKYIAHKASGVHSDMKKDEGDINLSIFRNCFSINNDGGIPTIKMDMDRMNFPDKPIEYNKSAIDGVLLEILTTVTMMANSRDVISLEEMIKQEMNL